MNVTIGDIAKSANVASPTVSRALNRPTIVGPTTRERVCAVGVSLGYKPNRAGQALENRRAANIGMIVSDPEDLGYPDQVRGAQQAGRDGGLTTFIAFGDADAADMAVINDLLPHVDVIMCGSQLADKQIANAQRLIPVVVVNRSASGISSIVEEHGIGMHCTLMHLIDYDAKRICPASGRHDDQVARTVGSVCQDAGGDSVAIVAAKATFDSGATAACSTSRLITRSYRTIFRPYRLTS